MASYGLTDAGFQMPTYSDLQSSYASAFKSTFGSDMSTSTDSFAGMLISILAYTDYTLWEGVQSVYNSQTLNGAEGIYLDDILSQRGLFRKSATAGSGYAVVKSTKSASWTSTIGTSTYFTASNGLFYYVSSETSLRASIAAYSITKSQATAIGNSLTFYVKNTSSGATNSVTLTTSSSTFLTDLKTFFTDNLSTTDKNKIFVSGTTLYVGFDSDDTSSPTGLSTPTKIYASSSVGIKWSRIPVTGTTTGVYSVEVGDISGISSTFTGYVSSTNFTLFSSGTDIETDAEFRSRFNDEQDEATAATRPAIVNALLDLDGVTKVRIYDNPTSTDTTYADAFTFNTIVAGGTVSDIAQALYDTKPINTLTYGTTSYVIDTEDGDTETIKFTVAEDSEYSIKIVYTTSNGYELSSTEQSAILVNLTALSADFEIASTISNGQIKGVIYSALSFGRLTSLSVYVKLSSEADTSYSESDISPAYSQIPSLDLDNISYEYSTS